MDNHRKYNLVYEMLKFAEESKPFFKKGTKGKIALGVGAVTGAGLYARHQYKLHKDKLKMAKDHANDAKNKIRQTTRRIKRT